MTSNILPLFVAIPLGSAFLISLLGKRSSWFPQLWTTLALIMMLAVSIGSIFLLKDSGTVVYEVGAWKLPVGIVMVMDGLTCFMLITVNLVALLVGIYAINYMRMYTGQWKFYTLFLLMVTGMNGVIITGDMFNLFVFLEIASVASYALVAFGTEHEELEASFKYAVMSSLASLFVLLGIAFLYSYTSTLNMADMGLIFAESGSNRVRLFAAALFLVGLGLKAALVPFHAWLPDAHPSAPAPISAMLSGVLIKAIGVYALVRVLFNVIGATPTMCSMLMILGTLSMVIGVFLAIGQWDMKRLLAYHSISQVGYMMLGIGLATPLGIFGGLFHLFNHSMFKSLLFLNSGAVVYATGTRDLQEMGGLKEKMPVTAGTSMVASMSISGIPPFNGFWSKLIIIYACVQAGHPVFAFWAVLASILTLASFTKVQRYAFFGKLKENWAQLKEVPFAMQFSMVAFALLCLAGGLIYLVPQISSHFIDGAVNVVHSGKEYAEIVIGSIK